MNMCGIYEFNITYIYLQYFAVDLHVAVSRYHLQLQVLITHISKLPLLLLLSIVAVVVVLSPLCRVVTIICLKQMMFLWYIVCQILCSYIVKHKHYTLLYNIFVLNVLYFYCSTFQSTCAVPNFIIIFFYHGFFGCL